MYSKSPPPVPHHRPTTKRQEGRARRDAKKREKRIAAGYEQRNLERFNVDVHHDLDPATGGYRGGRLMPRQMGDMGTPAYTSRVKKDGEYTRADRKSLLKKGRAYKKAGRVATRIHDRFYDQMNENDRVSRKIKKKIRKAENAIDFWNDRAA